MTGPSFPFFQPPVSPSWTFQDQGDLGGTGAALSGLVEALNKQKIIEQQDQQNQMQHEQLMGAIQSRQLQNQEALDRIKLEKAKIKAEQDDKVREHELTLLSKKELKQAKDDAGTAQGAAREAQILPGVADANQQEPMDGITRFLLGLLLPEQSGGDGANPQGEAIGTALNSADAQKVLSPPAQAVGDWTVENKTKFNKRTGEVGGPVGPQASGDGTGSGTGTSPGGNKPMAAEVTDMIERRNAAVNVQSAIGSTISTAKLGKKIATEGKTGQFGEAAQVFDKFAIASGFASAKTLKGAAAREAYVMSATKESLQILASKVFGSGNSITEQDRKAALKLAAADLTLEPTTIKFALRGNLLIQAAKLEAYLNEMEMMKRNPSKGETPDSVERKWLSQLGGLEGGRKTVKQLQDAAEDVMPYAELQALIDTPAESAAAVRAEIRRGAKQ